MDANEKRRRVLRNIVGLGCVSLKGLVEVINTLRRDDIEFDEDVSRNYISKAIGDGALHLLGHVEVPSCSGALMRVPVMKVGPQLLQATT